MSAMCAMTQTTSRVLVESVQKYLFVIFIFKLGPTLLANLATKTAPQSSNRGNVTTLRGATRDFEHT